MPSLAGSGPLDMARNHIVIKATRGDAFNGYSDSAERGQLFCSIR